MKLQTEVQLPSLDFKLSYKDSIAFIGSCFVENISAKMQQTGFLIDVNPFGIVYNPLSAANEINELLDRKKYTVEDIFELDGACHSFSHHSRFSDASKEYCLNKINERLEYSYSFLEKASMLCITFGTANIYKLKSNGKVVSNCHKLPDNLFLKESLTPDKIVSTWKLLIDKLSALNPRLRILFTVSPIRHWKDGAHGNQRSKAKLLLATDLLVEHFPQCYYFPSYEIMLDELRDYRFYADDMLHPSELAIEYIWEKFTCSFFGKETQNAMKEWKDIQKFLSHKPFNPDSPDYQNTLEKTMLRLQQFKQKYIN